MFESAETLASDYDDAQLATMLALAKQRSTTFRRRQRRRRSMTGALALLLVIALGTAYVIRPAGTTRPGHTSATKPQPAMKAPSWKLAGDVTQATWKLDTSSASQRGFALTCPDATTCYLEDLQVDVSSGPAPTLIEVTHDGGTTWQRSSLPGDITPTTGIDCVDADTCFAGGQDPSGNNEIVTTDDGGQSWTVLPMSLQFPSPFQFADISCVTTTSCVAVGTSGGFADGPSSAVITTNGGRSWTTSDFPAAFVPSKVRCVTGGTCLTVGYEGQASAVGAILYSTDGGSTWSTATVPAGFGPSTAIWCSSDGSNCLAVAFYTTPASPLASSVLTSTDGGRTWAEAGAGGPPFSILTSLSCVTSSYCWTSGLTLDATSVSRPRQPLLAMTTDAGQSWQAAQLSASLNLIAVPAVSCPDATTCFAIGIQDTGKNPFVLLSYSS